jgi:hypothetical protein
VTGLIQRIKGGKNLLGRKVRVTACYNTNADPVGGPAAGVSVWLMGKVVKVTAGGGAVLGGTGGNFGETPGAYPSYVFNDTVGGAPNFDVNTLPGDTLFVVNETALAFSSYVPRGLYAIVHSPLPTATVVNVDINGHGLNFTGNGPGDQRYFTFRGNSGMGRYGFQMAHSTVVPGCVVHVTLPGGTYDDLNLMNPFFDALIPVARSVAAPNPAADTASVYLFGDYVRHNVPDGSGNLNASINGWWHDDNYNGGFDAWVIPADGFSGTAAADGVQLLVQDFSAVDANAHFVETIVEVDASLLTSEDDLWIAVFPNDPRTQTAGGGHSGYKVNLYALTLELIPEEGADDPLDPIMGRLLKGFNPSSLIHAVNVNDALMDKYLVPKRYPIPMNMALPASLKTANRFHRFGGFGPAPAPIGTRGYTLTNDNTDAGNWDSHPFWVPIPGIPSGAIVTGFRFGIQADDMNPDGDIEVRLWQFPNDLDDSDLFGEGQLIAAAHAGRYNPATVFTGPSMNVNMQTGRSVVGLESGNLILYRNRVGLWVTSGSVHPTYGSVALLGASVWLEFIPRLNAAVVDANAWLLLDHGYVDCLVDPRTADMRWTP